MNEDRQTHLFEEHASLNISSTDIVFQRSLRARRYRLTLKRDGTAVATIPIHGNEKEAREFVSQQREWIARARERQLARPALPKHWQPGTHLLWRGSLVEILRCPDSPRPCIKLGHETFRVPSFEADLRPTLEAHFQRLAKIELSARTWELAAVTGMAVRQVSIRNQRTRWGSCTTGGVISLNWRLIQCPASVSDYVIYHELMHLREMNHSPRFWSRVAEVCPDWETAEAWLKRHGSLLGL